MLRIIFHEHQLGAAHPIIARLLYRHTDLDHILLGIKGQDSEAVGGDAAAVGDIGPGMDITAAGAAVAVLSAPVGVGHQQMAVFVGLGVLLFSLIPDLDAVGPQPAGIVAVQPGGPERGLQIHQIGRAHV